MLLEQVVIKTGTFKYHLLDCNGEGPDKWRSVSVKLVDVAFLCIGKNGFMLSTLRQGGPYLIVDLDHA